MTIRAWLLIALFALLYPFARKGERDRTFDSWLDEVDQ